MVDKPGRYTVAIGNDCEEVSQSFEVTECESCNVYVPNAISPNGDGMNDFLQVFANCPIETYQLKIFNRWGGVVFSSENIDEGWDGRFNDTESGMGTYIYMIQLRILENGQAEDLTLSGEITIIR